MATPPTPASSTLLTPPHSPDRRKQHARSQTPRLGHHLQPTTLRRMPSSASIAKQASTQAPLHQLQETTPPASPGPEEPISFPPFLGELGFSRSAGWPRQWSPSSVPHAPTPFPLLPSGASTSENASRPRSSSILDAVSSLPKAQTQRAPTLSESLEDDSEGLWALAQLTTTEDPHHRFESLAKIILADGATESPSSFLRTALGKKLTAPAISSPPTSSLDRICETESAKEVDNCNAPFCMEGRDWDYDLFTDKETLIIHFDTSGMPGAFPFSVLPESLEPQVLTIIDVSVVKQFRTWFQEETPNVRFYPDPSDETVDWAAPRSTSRTQEEEERIARWMLRGLVLIRRIHGKLREKFSEFEQAGMKKLRVCWFPPAFNDPLEDGLGKQRFWFPCHGPYLSTQEMVESDTIHFEHTRIFTLINVHFPNILAEQSLQDTSA
ncbi:hypothetical protein BJ508DRAFT_366000 [Ascobolus immersus RN42]|uniref:Uncharacterized protein n=1 Tax=Ascobolus immersus RN42 TaxID=1160509 RepID=A0A3N4HRZ8_ASCIM|nr:hypothetical protein BJ508DRAFT_366000 [Ascobolus immersus RN42]